MCSAESTPDPNGGSTTTKPAETTIRNPNRRSNKPIMEKRRRARINNCLNELKGILLEAMRKDPARHSKLEKADILELTVSHLKALHRHGNAVPNGIENTVRFRNGFAECASQVERFLQSPKSEGIDKNTSGRLMSHLHECINTPVLNGQTHPHGQTQLTSIDTNGNLTTTINVPPNTPIISLVPSRLSSGEIAFVVPGFSNSGSRQPPSLTAMQMQCNPPPMLSPEVPLELTVPSSSSSGCSLSPSYPIGHHGYNHPSLPHHPYPLQQQQQQNQHHNVQQPLSLVTQRREDPDMSCWRPW